jgi:hypothetical protein
MKGASRRDVVKWLGVSAVSPLLAWSQGPKMKSDAQPAYTDRAAAEQWMDSWIRDRKAAGGVLHLSRFADPTYFLTREIGWTPNQDQADTHKHVLGPVGFVTDFASIPRVFWSVLRPDGIYTYAAIVHDYLYWEQPVARETADEIFKFAMEDFRVDGATIAAIYAAVRVGGEVPGRATLVSRRRENVVC